MYAIIKTGGKQYQVATGDQVRVEKLPGSVGDTLELEDVLMVVEDGKTVIGKPVVDGAKVKATISEQGKHRKINVFKKKRRKGYRLMKGHRQAYTSLKIDEITR